jgi:hypothetical protein
VTFLVNFGILFLETAQYQTPVFKIVNLATGLTMAAPGAGVGVIKLFISVIYKDP